MPCLTISHVFKSSVDDQRIKASQFSTAVAWCISPSVERIGNKWYNSDSGSSGMSEEPNLLLQKFDLLYKLLIPM